MSVAAVLAAGSGPWPSHPPAFADDVNSIDAIVRAMYASVSFTEGRGPDADRLASLCVPHGRLIKVHANNIDDMSVPEFVERVQTRISEQGLRGFAERELFRRTEVFAGIAHVFTTYESHTDDGGADHLLYRGINSVQLRHDGRRWWILTILWTDEREDCPIPAAYLPRT
ncbi:hypothetical protein [Nannocystis radixulma]|uniref:SnoaL-like domain-containing protein n=1 Tax=Nannocystis radixulma TaxID=2995305 RepID=A0ABT5B2R0_9BACT|nr:hypothetical protein [Nannocystis radixulma]MDC0667432.1 hypothetical protein [Nannocystis radixulma]